MEEKNLNFDNVVDRKNTDCLKYDFAVRRGKPENVLPLWVADMDFPTSSLITDDIVKRAEHGIFGYTEVGEKYFEAVHKWMLEKHNWETNPKWLVKTPGVVFALAMAVKAFTNEGECVLIQKPVYYPFFEVTEDNGRIVVSNDLVLEDDGKYHIDFDDFENKITENNIKLFLFCSPQNPTGRVWTENELLKIGEICKRHNVIVVSDEIHEDFVFGNNRHIVFADLRDDFGSFTITCTSPAKTFNLAGLQISNIFISNPMLKAAFKKQINAAGYSQLNTMGLTACESAYRNGDVWYNAVKKYLESNIEYVKSFLKNELPEIKLIEPEGTYLLWLDFRGLNLTNTQREKLIVEKAGLWLDSGDIFGKAGEGFERINIACPIKTLRTAMEKLKHAVKYYKQYL